MTWLDPVVADPADGSTAAEITALVNELRAAGVPATDDPDLIIPMLTDVGAGVLVAPPEVSQPYLNGTQIDAVIAVSLAGNPPGGRTQWVPVWRLLPAVLRVCRAPARPVTLNVSDLALPAMRLTAARTYHATELT